MLKFNKDFNAKIISIIITVLFLFNSAVYGIDLPRNTPPNKLRVPIGDSGRMKEAISVTEARDLLIDRKHRPEPLDVKKLSLQDIKEGARLAFGIEDFSQFEDSLTFKELENILPYIFDMVKEVLTKFPNHKIILFGRDAEIFYDVFKTIFENTPEENRAMLFPANDTLWIKTFNPDEEALYSEEGRKRFFEYFGITEAAIKRGDKFVMLDTGFRDSNAENAQRVISKLYRQKDGWEIDPEIAKAFPSVVIGNLPEREFYAPELMPFNIRKEQLEEQFPKTMPVALKDTKGKWTPNYILAVVLQLLPHFHAEYNRLKERNGRIFAVPFNKSTISQDIDKADSLNDSIVNPVAAMLVQKKVIDYFSARKSELLATIMPAEMAKDVLTST